MDLKLAGRRAIVTGGSRGIGRAIVERLVAEGVSVALCARGEKDVTAAVASQAGKGPKVIGRALDVSDHAALAEFTGWAATELGGLDIAVANASALAEGSGTAAFRAAFETDLLHTVTLAEAAVPHLKKATGSAFIAISSISGSEEYGYDGVAYGTMKAALLFYMKALANHLAPKGIRANTVSPGTTYFPGGSWAAVERDAPEVFARTLKENPMGRMGRPEEIADAVVFLASPVSSFTAGANLVVDGGYTHRIQN
ncbi:MAG: SDR family oxidoreductase [Hyphomicrobiaceae bacterium]